jgi:hypothetical protein
VSEWRRSDSRPAAVLPPWLQPASVGARLGAWLIDFVFMGLLGLIPAGVAVAAGGLAWNPEALRQVGNDPFGTPSVPWLAVQTGPLVAAAVVWVASTMVYGTIGWRLGRGQPGQRMRSIEVADARTGRNLSTAAALWRAVLVNGIPATATAAVAVSVAELLAIVPGNAAGDPSLLESGAAAAWSAVLSVATIAGLVWSVAILISTSSSAQRRGLHDRLAGSIAVRLPRVASWYGMPGPGAYAPGGTPWSGLPPPRSGPAGSPGPGFSGPPPAGPDSARPPAAPRPQVWTGLAQPGAYSGQSPTGEGASEAAPEAAAGRDSGPETGGASERTPDSAIEDRPAASTSESEGRPRGPRGLLADRPPVRTGKFGSKLPEGLRVATYRRRAAAYGLDSILVLTVYSAIQAILAPAGPTGELPPERSWMLAGLLGGLAQAVYFVGGWWLLRGTIGQRVLSLQVGRESSGKRLGPGDALVRWAVLQGPVSLFMAAPYVTEVLLFVVVVGWAIVLSRSVRDEPDGRGYHDRLAGSMVVEEV